MTIDLDQLERDALRRLRRYINHCAAQHLRRMREKWSRS